MTSNIQKTKKPYKMKVISLQEMTPKISLGLTATQKKSFKIKKNTQNEITPQYHQINKKRNEKFYKMKVVSPYDLTSKTIFRPYRNRKEVNLLR